MSSLSRFLTAGSSTLLRVAFYFFTQIMPGHHVPPVLLACLTVYLTLVGFALKSQKYPENRQTANGNATHTNGKAVAVKQTSRPDPVPSKGAPERTPNALTTLVLGLPSSQSSLLTVVSVSINVLLAVLAVDAILRPPFMYPSNELSLVRVGYVTDTTAKILLREPDSSQLPLVVHYGPAERSSSETWKTSDSIKDLSNATDFTFSMTLEQLRPATEYEYSVSNNRTGRFRTAPMKNDPESSRLAFVTSSCIKPNFPYNPFRHPLHIPGLTAFSDVLQTLSEKARPAFMLFLGDFIYVDVPWRLSSSLSHYRSEYRRVYSSPSWRAPGLSGVPWLHVLDDHEIANDWAGNTTQPYPAAADPFLNYHVSVNPPRPAEAPPNATYFSFTRGPASFFLLDSRKYRSLTAEPPTMLGKQQLDSLLDFIHRPIPKGVKWKIVVSSVPFTKNWRFGTIDTWGGYLDERKTILNAMWEAERRYGVGIVVLSGDRHEFGATKFPDPSTGQVVYEFSVGPLSMFSLPVRTYWQTDEEDIAIKYLPDGQSKFGLVEIENMPFGGQSVLKYRLFINAKEAWNYVITSPALDGAQVGMKALWDPVGSE